MRIVLGCIPGVILYGMGELQQMLQLPLLGWLLIGAGGCLGPPDHQPPQMTASVPNGRVENQAGLRVVHLWGTPEERGRAHAQLLGPEITVLLRKEFDYRFGSKPQLLDMARGLVRRRVSFPVPMRAELRALFETIKASGLDLSLPTFGRDIDLADLLLMNALDIFAEMGCSGFTVWDQSVAGGGVLTCRNFDWFVSGPHMVDSCILLVQHPHQGKSFATMTWPGYVMAVTGVNADGVCVFLHAGNGRRTMALRRGCVSTATAARQILEEATVANGFELARRALAQTSPPSSYLTRVVLPGTPAGESGPVRVFEADHREVIERKEERLCVVTNHFVVARDPAAAGPDSGGRYRDLVGCLDEYLRADDRRVSADEAWRALARVQKSGHRFASLHSMVFRQSPWVFELALGKLDSKGRVQGAPGSPRRYRLRREGVFRGNPR